MKKNNFDFSIPTRQSYAAIIMIIYKYYKIIISQALPLILIVFISGKSGANWKTKMIYVVIAFSILAMIYAIIAYFKYYFHIAGNELIVDKGVMRRKRTSIPFDRIQTINIEQNIFHQLLNVVKLVVDTAGTSTNEFEFDALSRDKAEALKSFILARKQNISIADGEDSREQTIPYQAYKTILEIDIVRLIKIGMTENHLRSGALIFAFVFWFYENLSDAGVELKNYESQLKESAINFATFLIVAFLFISFVVSLIRTVLRHYNLRFLRSEDGFAVSSGLLTKKQVAAKDHKIQMLVFKDNLLKKLLGYKDLLFKQASSVEIENKKSIKIPGCSQEHLDAVIKVLYGKENLMDLSFSKVEKAYLYRYWLYQTLGYVFLLSFAILLEQKWMAAGTTLLWVYLMITMYFKYQKTKFAFNHQMIHIKGGIFGDKDTILPIYKIQAIRMKQTPYQRRKSLADVVINTASGGTSIPYLQKDLADSIINYFLYKVEIDRRKWM